MGHTSNRNHQRENAKGKRTQQRGTKKLVGAVGIEFIKPQNRKELCGTCRSHKSFVVLGRNCNCPRIAPAFLQQISRGFPFRQNHSNDSAVGFTQCG